MKLRQPQELLELAALDLEKFPERVVFVGGAIVGLLITDHAAPPASGTKDLDVVVSVASTRELHNLREPLLQLGFVEDTTDGAPICRWRKRDGYIIDVMPTDPKILDFSNRWFQCAFETANQVTLPGGREIFVVTAACFLGTKIEAFASRGKGDYMASKDIKDLVAVIHGRNEVVAEIAAGPRDLRQYLASQAKILLNERHFMASIEGHLPGEDHQRVVSQLAEIARLPGNP